MSERLVYNYLPECFGQLALEKRRLKVGLFTDLNDPFELLANKLTDAKKRRRLRKRIRQLGERVGVLCFSRSWQNPVMWSHYADKHRGICLGFSIADELLLQVRYCEKRAAQDLSPLLDGQEPRKEFKGLLFGTKYKAWRYEEEVRVVIDLSDGIEKKGLHFRPFGNGIELREVIVGPRCPVGRQIVESTLSRSELSGVRVLKARLAFGSFRVVENRQGFRYSQSKKWSPAEGSCADPGV